jgi:hypothetical protein
VKVRPYLLLVSIAILVFYSYSSAQLPKSVGREACARCHQYERRTITGTPHEDGKSCEGCHGAGEKHLTSGGDAGSMFSYNRGTAEEVRARCGQCHRNPVMSKHAEGDVACTACHSMHHYIQKKYLLKPENPEMKPA